MYRKPVVSSNIKSLGYDKFRKKLEVEFKNGGVYRYKGVPKEVFNQINNADSKGKFLNKEIKYNFPYRKYKDGNGDLVLGKWRKLDKPEPKEIEKEAALKPDVVLRPHQQKVVDNPATSQIIAHGVGSGKTLTGIAKFEKMKERGDANRALVVVPSGLRDNFGGSGVKKFTDSTYNIIGNQQEIRNKTYNTANPNSDYNIMSYEMYRKNPEKVIKNIGADTLIFDEAQKSKNEGTLTTDAMKRARHLYKNHIGLTGSLISNSISDVHPLVDVMTDGKHNLGENKDEFIEKNLVRSNSNLYKKMNKKRIPIVGFRNPQALGKELSQYVDFLDYDDLKSIADMPDKKVSVSKVPLSKEQAKIYRGILKKNKDIRKMITMKRLETLKDDEAARSFSSLAEARKLMNSVGSIKPGISLTESSKITPKTSKLLDDLDEHLRTTPDGQAVLLTNLVRGGTDVLEAGLKDRGIPYGTFMGKGNKGVTEASRQADVQDYLKRKKRVMVVSPAGSEGLSLDNTTWEGVLDPHYNPERMNQMEARGIRAGGLKGRDDRTVNVNRYLATMPKQFGFIKSPYKTPDEFIYEIAQNKERQNQMLYNLLKKSRK